MVAPAGRLSIIDVGHGNSAVVASEGWIAVIDAGRGGSLLQFLIEQNITRIDEVLISHADEDHLGGPVGVLASGLFTVGRVRLNSDAAKQSKIWKDVAVALDDAQRKGAIDFKPALRPQTQENSTTASFMSKCSHRRRSWPPEVQGALTEKNGSYRRIR